MEALKFKNLNIKLLKISFLLLETVEFKSTKEDNFLKLLIALFKKKQLNLSEFVEHIVCALNLTDSLA
jgi:hypothetical protein